MSCPIPETDEEKEIAAEESKRYVSGDLQFLQDDPGRQTIGSFNPLTSEDWTDQAYLGNTESLCHAIVNEDVDFIKEWCVNNREKLDRRDHTGRTPLQLATQIDAVENVRILVDAGARMVSRLTDGLTALHIACINGNTEIINILLERSEANEELEAEKADGIRQKKKEVKDAKKAEEAGSQDDKVEISETTVSEMDSDEELIDSDDGNSDRFSMTQGSFVKVKTNTGNEDAIAEDQGDEPDFYDVNVLAWDAAVSPLHLAIICGHVEVIKLLISKFGADVLLPVKLVSDYDSSPTGAILTLVLAARNMDRSVELTKALLDLGASPSQSDVQQFSALHTVALLGNIAAMKIMMEKDLPKAKAAMNHIIVDHSAWRNSTLTPLKTILGAKDEPSAIELLKAGANPTIPFDDWAKAFLAATTVGHRHVSHDKASVVEKFTEVNQPVIDAASFDMPVAVEVLLDAGVDINQLNSDGLKLVSNSANTYVYEPGKSLLDIVISKVNSALPKVNFVPSPDPPKLLSQHEYLRTYESGTYQYWQVQNQYVLCNEVLRDWQKMKDGHDSAERKDFSNVTKKTIDEAKESRNQYQKIRTRLLAAGAKRFEQLHPEVYPNNGRRNVDTLEIDEPQYGDTVPGTILLVIDYEIPTVHDTDTTRYTQLFEAAWKGDKESIKALTTKPDVNGNVLSMAVQDNMNISPLHIAIWRGDYDIAEMMLEIAHLQYNPSEAKDGKRNYYIRDRDPDDYDCGSSNSDAGSEDFYVSSDLVNQNFTIDDVANLAQQAGSKTSVLEFLSWSGQFWMFASLPGVHSASHLGKLSAFTKTDYLKNWNRSKTSINFFQDHFGHRSTQNGINVLQFAIDTGDANLLKLILKWYNTYEPYLKTKEGSYVQNSWDKPSESSHLFRALRAGHMNLASELVSSLGNGMPIESLAKDSGIQDSETSKYYQGLLLRGKHKQEWANEANKTGYTEQSQDWLKTSLLLQSVVGDSVAAVEWCLSDSPARLLKEWLSKNEDDQIKRLAQANGGFHKFINDWLDSRRNLAIHMAVLSNKWESEQPDERAAAAEILKYLIRVLPESLETKNVTGHTPLALAFWTRRFEPLSILISAGANQATRDYKGANIAHLAVYQTEAWTEERVEILDKSLAFIDRKLIKSLFVERCSLGPSGMTPLAVWLWKYRQNSVKDKQDKMMVKCLETLLKYMDLEPLRMLDGGGQMPIHSCVKQNYVVLLEFLCNKYPELVLLENGMGQTALELCSSIYTGEVISRNNAPGTFFTAYTYLPLHSRSFQDPPAHSKALNLLESAQAKVSSKKRVLISALQASEVVKRLAATKKKESKSGFSSYPYRYQDQFKAQDEVQQWLSTKGYWNMYTS